jgi:hypothetical protein
MKQTITTILLFLLFGVGAMGQSTYLNPIGGFTHTYEATVVDPGGVNPVRWFVSTDANGSSKATHGTDYTFVTEGYNPANNQLEGTALYEVELNWGTGTSAGDVFYVFIEVDDNLTNCTNRMALVVSISSQFNALVYNVTNSATPGTVDPSDPDNDIETETCPDDVINPIWDGSGHTDIGYSELVFRVEREHSVLDWQFEYALSETAAQPFTVSNVRIINPSGTQIYSGADLSRVQGVANAHDYVLMIVQVDNQQGVTLNLELNLINANNNTRDSGGNIDVEAADNTAAHTLLPMPEISGFGGN